MKKVSFYFGFIMILTYLVVGILFLFSDWLQNIVTAYRPALGGVFVAYAGFRVVIAVQHLRRNTNESIEEEIK